MIRIRNHPDTEVLTHDPEQQREVISYLLYCQMELMFPFTAVQGHRLFSCI